MGVRLGLTAVAVAAIAGSAHAQDMPGMTMPQASAPHAGRDMGDMPGMVMPGASEAEGVQRIMVMPLRLERATGSGTSLLPGYVPPMHGLHVMAGGWMLMAHGYVWGVYSDQGGPRGDDKAFAESMVMLQASRPLGDRSSIQLRAMLSLDPLMGQRGYPNLFASGETAHGVPLVDRQHPHDLFMELSGRIDTDVGSGTRAFLYAGLPGEPALGPSAFMHRASARLNPEAPITHHWFDSTHISFGVVTAGVTGRAWQLEASAFNGREPDEKRYDIETPRLDSWSVRASWRPASRWLASLSFGRLNAPERQEPGVDQTRLIAALGYTGGAVTATAGFSRKHQVGGRTLDAGFAEATWTITPRHALFGRVERVRNDELFPGTASPLHGRPFTVTKATGGYGYTIPLTGPLALTLGGSVSGYDKPRLLDAAYGRRPLSYTGFAKLALGG